jgi:uncharacterized protein (DUF2141 family)
MLSRIPIFTCFICLSFPILGQTTSLNNTTGKLTVKVIGFESDRGDCWFALDNCEGIYESEDSVWIGKIPPIKNNQVIVEIDSLEFREYAVRVFHDENKNEELDTNFLGIPTEDYGYSNNVSAWFGPPSWERAKFLFNIKEMLIEIDID